MFELNTHSPSLIN